MGGLYIPFQSEPLKKHLLQDVVGFWLRHSPDGQGGYYHCLKRDGTPVRDTRHLVTHTRLIYGFAEAVRLGGRDMRKDFEPHVRQAVDYLHMGFADSVNSGWFWAISAAGDPIEPQKRAYGHAFAAYSLAVAAQALADAGLRPAAQDAYGLLRQRFFDLQYGGVHEEFTQTWQLTSSHKTLSTHLHVVEAALEQCRLTRDREAIEDLMALVEVFLERVYDTKRGCAGERFGADWSATDEPPWVGHNLEAAWFLLQVAELRGRLEYAETALRLIDWSLAHGWDTKLGAFHYKCTPSGQVSDASKSWWVQTEGLVALLSAWRHTGDERYCHYAERLWDFCNTHLIDHEFGEWFSGLGPDGRRTSDEKGNAWKGPYHVTQSLTACATLLSSAVP